MKLTKKRALEICRDLWGWLAETGEMDKMAWPGWAECGGVAAYAHSCPCCTECCMDCAFCLLLAHWTDGLDGAEEDAVPCERPGSPYSTWEGAAIRSAQRRRIAAGVIRDAAIAELEKL